MSGVALQARDVSRWAGGKTLVEAASLALRSGEVLGIIGPNGAGKSTLVRMLAGLDRPDRGEITLLGRPLMQWPAHERARRLGYLPQHFTPHWDYRVTELLRLGLDRTPQGMAGLSALAAQHGLEPLLERRWSSLSGGERGRSLAAAVLAPSPGVILADEPAAALDIGQAAALMALLKGRAAMGAAVAVVVHDLNLAFRWCDRIAAMGGGRIRGEGVPSAMSAPGVLEDIFGIEFERLHAADGSAVVLAVRRPQG
ncbi:ABC transporter ATP-binding protein [Roseococcus sp. SDR]|uniref:ABC transporter ATP-binding protein n=1 Tax=Roseococcus sp. SDR TaxID=2835532 RepID=UPI001BD1076C|nr:ABC transporter ATP-binding protein [Roseococcus sp. SDR]MBS7792312.1 ABC transporter ATP-binding protein [Roseococcus sp. SDR]MBV1847626.1 ABC transporter ATP-binding protein [Roseococcus sp. SDR]